MFGKSHSEKTVTSRRYERAVTSYNAGEYDKALREYFDALASGELDAAERYLSYVGVALCYIVEKSYDSAMRYLDYALKQNDEHYRAYFEYGRVYFAQNEFESALKYFEQAVNREKEDVWTWYYYGVSYYHLKRYREAVNALKIAHALKSEKGSNETVDIWEALDKAEFYIIKEEGKKYFEEKNFAAAIEKYDTFLYKKGGHSQSFFPKNKDLRDEIKWLRGKCFLELGQTDKAISDFESVVWYSSNRTVRLNAYLDLGICHFNNRDFESASMCFSKGLQICNEKKTTNAPIDMSIDISFGAFIEFIYYEGRLLSSFSHREQIHIFSTWSQWTQIQISYLKKDFQGALNLLESLDPIRADMRTGRIIMRGKTLYLLGRYEEAITCLKEMLEDNGYGIDAYGYIGCSYQKMGLHERALRYFEGGKQKGTTNDVTVWISSGDCYSSLKQYEKAIETYRKALECLDINDESCITEIEVKIKSAKQNMEQNEAKKRPTHITIQGNNSAPINIGGIQATDDSIINRPTIQMEEEEVITAFCPQCGCRVDAEDRFCRKCGGMLK